MCLKTHPMIAPRSAAEIRKIVETHAHIYGDARALPGVLLRHAGVPTAVTKAVVTQAPFPECAETVAEHHGAFIAAASEEDLVDLILRRAISETRHVDFEVWGRRLDARVAEALGVPTGTVQGELDAGTCEEGGLARLSAAVAAAYARTQASFPEP